MFAKKTAAAQPQPVEGTPPPAASVAPAEPSSPASAVAPAPPPPSVADALASLDAAKAAVAELESQQRNRETSLRELEHEAAEVAARLAELAARESVTMDEVVEADNGRRRAAGLQKRSADVRAAIDAAQTPLASARGALVAAERILSRATALDLDARLGALVDDFQTAAQPLVDALVAALRAGDAGCVLGEELRWSPEPRFRRSLGSWAATKTTSVVTALGLALDAAAADARAAAKVAVETATWAAEEARKRAAEEKARAAGLVGDAAFYSHSKPPTADVEPVSSTYLPPAFL